MTWVTGISAAAAAVRAIALSRILSRYTPGSGKALAVMLAMRGGMAANMRSATGRCLPADDPSFDCDAQP